MHREYVEEKWIGIKTMLAISVVIGTAMWGLGLWLVVDFIQNLGQ